MNKKYILNIKYFKYLICIYKGHKLKRLRAEQLNFKLSWPGWKEWAGVRCTRCFMVGGTRNKKRMRSFK